MEQEVRCPTCGGIVMALTRMRFVDDVVTKPCAHNVIAERVEGELLPRLSVPL